MTLPICIMQNMKPIVLIVGPVPPPYHGVSVITEMVLSSKIKDKYLLIHLDTTDKRDLRNINKLDFQNLWLVIKNIVDLINLLIHYRPQIMYLPICQTLKGLIRDYLFMLLAKIRNTKIVIHLHGSYFRTLYDNSNIFGKFFISKCCKLFSRALVVGESLRYIFEDLVPSYRIDVVSVGIDKGFVNYNPSYILKQNSDSLKILFLSNLTLTKGFYDVIKSIPLVVQKFDAIYNRLEFIFAGEFWDTYATMREVKEYISEKNITSYIKFCGRVTGTAKQNLYLSSHIFVLPTYYNNEGQPTVILEAMAAGLPVIATDKGAIKDMVIDGYNGFIIPPKNPAAIAEKIIYLVKNEDERCRMGNNSRQLFLQKFTLEKFIGNLDRIFTEVLSE